MTEGGDESGRVLKMEVSSINHPDEKRAAPMLRSS